jgi:HlyD family secretion protein
VDGIVISRDVDVGQTVAASMSAPTLFVIANDLTRMQVDASIDEADIGRVEAGQDVRFRVDAYPDDVFTGSVTQVRLQPVVTQNVVSYTTVIDVPNVDGRLKPGMTANVSIEVARADDVITVPNAALRFTHPADAALPIPVDEEEFGGRVWIVRDGQLAPLLVETGVSNETTTAIVGGELEERMRVVTGIASSDAPPPERSESPLIPQRRGRRGGGRS